MSEDKRKEGGRGRRWPGRGQGPRKTAGPTAPRLIAIRVIERVHRAGAFADLALHHALVQSRMPAADRGLATELVYGTLRWRGRLDYLISKALDKDLSKLEPLVTSALRVGAYQLFFSDRIPANAAVDEAVRCVRAMGLERATGLVNAVLRRLAREGETYTFPPLESDPLAHLMYACSLPEWLAKRWLEQYGAEGAARLAMSMNEPAPVTVRVNRTKTNREEMLEALRERFPEARAGRYAPDAIVLGRRGDVGQDPAFVSGLISPQDEASQLVVELLDPQPGERILDTCAAPGTKSAAIAERLAGEGHVLALDRHPKRLALVGRGVRRLEVGGVATLERDATKPMTELAAEDGPFDRILIDAPCSGLGALRRNPDARWRLREEDFEELARIQREIIESAAAVLRPGGSLVYSTCTVTPEENEGVIRGFMATRANWRIAGPEEAPESIRPLMDEDGFLRTLFPPDRVAQTSDSAEGEEASAPDSAADSSLDPPLDSPLDMDGFFAVRLVRNLPNDG